MFCSSGRPCGLGTLIHMEYVLLFMVGTSVGSFLNVVAYRLPRRLDLVRRPSSCTSCGTCLAWYDLVPVLSYILLRGRCRGCHARVAPSYPVVELAAGGSVLATVGFYGWTSVALLATLLSWVLLVAALIDARWRVIPNGLLVSAACMAAGVHLAVLPGRILPSVAAGAVGGGVFLAVRQFHASMTGRKGLGMGDVKLVAVMGLCLGWSAVTMVYLACVVSALLGTLGIVAGRLHRRSRVPFAPFAAVGFWIYHVARPLLPAWIP